MSGWAVGAGARAFVLLGVLLAGCSDESPVAPDLVRRDAPAEPAPPGADSPDWTSEVSARIRDASHGFSQDGDDWVGEVPERSMTGRFGADGARIALQDDSLGVRVRRLELASDGLTEWWASRDEGFEQGFVVDSAPDGGGELAINLAVEDADVVLGDGDLWLDGDGGATVVVTALAAWDADGSALEARFVEVDGGFGIRVEDEGAAYPVEIDPLYETADWSVKFEPLEKVAPVNPGVQFGEGIAKALVLNRQDAKAAKKPSRSPP